MQRILVCVLLTSAAVLSAQAPDAALARLSDLSRQGQPASLMQAAKSLLAAGHLADADQGIALTYLGNAFQQTGDFQQATTCYEKALSVINRDGLHAREYASVLATFATLYAEAGQSDTAKHVLLRSVEVLERQNDHAGAAAIFNDLATLSADEHSMRAARDYMARAIAESKLAPNFPGDELAALTSTEARIAQFEGDPHAAVSGYQRALALWKQSHDDQHPQTGWLYVLLGGAYLECGDLDNARATTLRGLQSLERNSGPKSTRYLAAELAYSKILKASGSRDEATTLRKQAEAALTAGTRPTQSEISVAALR